VDQLIQLAVQAPEVYRDLIRQKKLDQRRRYHINWADIVAQIVGHLTGLAALLVLAVLAWHAFDRDAPTQASTIICTGAASIVAVFVTGRLVNRGAKSERAAKRDNKS
jgi:predicted membrane channel-forming protein YqfA (hemolysin III family)